MPAGHLPPKRENTFANVSPRFLDPVHRQQPNYVPPEQERYDTQRQWQGTAPRYLLNVSSHEQEKLREEQKIKEQSRQGDHSDPLAGWNEGRQHREYTKRHFNVQSKYAEHAEQVGHPDVSPRDLVAKKDESAKLERGWRGTHALNHHTTFDVMYKKWLKQHAEDSFMKRKKNSARSPVADFVKHGTPIESTSRGASPIKRASTPNPNNNNTSNASGGNNNTSNHNNHSVTRTQSPWERTHYSPDTYIGGRWKSGGVTSTGFDALKRQSLKLNHQYALSEERAQAVISHQTEKKVSKDFVPRVAKLALVYQIPNSSSRTNSPSMMMNNNSGRGGSVNNSGSRANSPGANNNNSARRGTTSPQKVAVKNATATNGGGGGGYSMMNNNNKTSSAKTTTYNIGDNNNNNNNNENESLGRRRTGEQSSSPTRRL